jgi:hypothetical protein
MGSTQRRKRIILAVISAVVLVLAILNPSMRQHKEAEEAAVRNTQTENPELNAYVRGTADRLVYHNFIIFSVTTDPGAKGLFGPPIATIGFCGIVTVEPAPEGYG